MAFIVINIIALIFVLIGSINWGLIGIFNWNLVSAIFGALTSPGSVVIYVLVFLSSLWLIFALFYQGRRLLFRRDDVESNGRSAYND